MTASTSTTGTITRTTAGARAPRRALSITVWVFQVLLALFFVAAAVPKILGDAASVAAFEQMGAGQWFRVVTGLVELAGAIGLVIPRLSSLASIGLALVMVFASYVNLALMGQGAASLVITGALCAAFAYIAWVRRHQNRRLVESLRR